MVGRSLWSRETPIPLVAFPWGSRSTTRERCSCAAREAARLTAVVVLPTPPFWFTTARTNAMRPPLPHRGEARVPRGSHIDQGANRTFHLNRGERFRGSARRRRPASSGLGTCLGTPSDGVPKE